MTKVKKQRIDWDGDDGERLRKLVRVWTSHEDSLLAMAVLDLHRRQRRLAIAFWVLGLITGLAVSVTVGSCLYFGWMP